MIFPLIQSFGARAAIRWMIPALIAASALSAQTGRISGTLTDSSGKPIAGALVNARASRGSGGSGLRGILPISADGLTTGNGSFTISQLSAGTFQICVEPVQTEVLNPCVWGSNPTTATVPAGNSTISLPLTVQLGVTMLIRVDDSQSLLLSNSSGDDVQVATHHGQFSFLPARGVERDAQGKTLGLVVPAGTQVDVILQTTKFTLANNSGSPIQAGALPVSITAPQVSPTASYPNLGNAPPNLTIEVTGKSNGQQ